jgi:hypothetical protein
MYENRPGWQKLTAISKHRLSPYNIQPTWRVWRKAAPLVQGMQPGERLLGTGDR